MHPALLYLPGDRLSLPELSAARLDGDVVEIGDAYIPADLVETCAVRASSVAALVHPGTAAAGPTAAWIHGAGDRPPTVHHMQRASALRVRARITHRVVFHDAPLPAEDVWVIDGVAVSSPGRALRDMALSLYRSPEMLPWIERLAFTMPELLAESAAAIDELRRVPGTRVARECLQRLDVRTT